MPDAGPLTSVNPTPFIAACGDDAVSTDGAPYAVAGLTPALALRPPTVDALQAVLREATAGHLALLPHGGGSALATGNAPARYDLALDTRALNAIVDYQPDDFTITVQAGLSFAALEAVLAEQGQFLPLDPPLPARTTVGGVVARGRGGLRRAAFGDVRDWLIGSSAVLADGRLVKGGGRVVKNVSGYDLPKLFAGSWGTLGCIVQASFKLRPLPARDETLIVPLDDFAAAVEGGRRVAQQVPGLQAVLALDAAAAALVELPGSALVLRAAGMEPAARALLDTARAAAAASSSVAVPSEDAFWQPLADFAAPPGGDTVLLRLGLPPPKLAAGAAILHAAAPAATRLAAVDSGLLLAQLPAQGLTAAAIAGARAALAPLGGVLTVEAAPPALAATVDAWGGPPPGLPIMQRIKEELDPHAVLSPGRFAGGI